MNARARLKAWIGQHTNQRRFADDIGIDESYLSQALSGRRTPGLPILAKIEDLTGIPVRGWLPSANGDSDKPRRKTRKSRNLGKQKSEARVG